jgi:signal transduction histidine kinase
MTTANQRKILIVSEDGGFSRDLIQRWRCERVAPNFMEAGDNAAHTLNLDHFDLAVVHVAQRDVHRELRHALEESGRPGILVCGSAQILQAVRKESPRALSLMRNEGWSDFVVLLASEMLRRVDAVNRAERAEHVSALLKCNATLGQYVIEMRHSLNNALTSVLGNSELLLLEPGAFSAGVRSQIDTIRNMAMRMHEILQRFSSLEKELMFVEQQALKEQRKESQVAAAGS